MNFFKYTLVRFGLLVFFFYLYELLGAGILVSGGCAIVSAFAVAYIFFPRLHVAASQDTARFFKRTPKVKNKEEEENRAEMRNKSGDSNNFAASTANKL